MRKSTVVLAALAALVWACGSTPITVGGVTLQPQSSDMFQVLGIPYVIVSDVPDFCTKVKAQAAQVDCNTSGSSNTSPFGTTGSYLMILALGASDGAKLNVLDGGFGGSTFASTGAVVYFGSNTGSASTTQFHTATGGTVNIEAFRSAQSISGGYNVGFDNGEQKSGHFAANYCDGYGGLFGGGTNTRACGYSLSGSSNCSRDCSCNSKSVSASCSQNTGLSTWTCACSDANGGSSTCTMQTAPDCTIDTGTCCPLRF